MVPFSNHVYLEVLADNVSSVATAINAGMLALMDAGVAITEPIAAVSVGLITEYRSSEEGSAAAVRSKLLLDVNELEEVYGDMDMDVVASRSGAISAFKFATSNVAAGVPREQFCEALSKGAVEASRLIERNFVRAIPQPRSGFKDTAPRHRVVELPLDTPLGLIIGPGGSNIRMLQDTCDVHMRIERLPVPCIHFYSSNDDKIEKALRMVRAILGSPPPPRGVGGRPKQPPHHAASHHAAPHHAASHGKPHSHQFSKPPAARSAPSAAFFATQPLRQPSSTSTPPTSPPTSQSAATSSLESNSSTSTSNAPEMRNATAKSETGTDTQQNRDPAPTQEADVTSEFIRLLEKAMNK